MDSGLVSLINRRDCTTFYLWTFSRASEKLHGKRLCDFDTSLNLYLKCDTDDITIFTPTKGRGSWTLIATPLTLLRKSGLHDRLSRHTHGPSGKSLQMRILPSSLGFYSGLPST